MPRRSESKQITDGGLAQKHPLPVDPYEIPDDNVPLKRPRRGLQQREKEGKKNTRDDTDAELRNGSNEGAPLDSATVQPTPTKKRRGRPPREDPTEPLNGKISTTPATSRQKNPIETPLKLSGLNGIDTPSRRNIADRSARRKSARALIDRVVDGAISDDEGEDEGIAREIYESSEDEDARQQDQESADDGEDGPVAVTPSKRRGRPPGPRKRSPTPPQDLPPHEQYFYQNKPGRAKTSNNNLSSLDLLTHDEYFALLRITKPTHTTNIQFLESLHAESFSQWYFELSQGFTTCLYGYGSKRRLLHQFATYISTKNQRAQPPNKIVVVNGYLRTTSIREILSTIGTAINPSHRIPSANPVAMVQNLFRLLDAEGSTLTLFINSIDAPPLRKTGTQSILAQLAAHPNIKLVCSADTSDFPLLWDSGLRSSFNFLFHDCTTFAPFGPEIEVVDEVHELLGRMARRVGGKEGVTFVLRSLPENAKSLFRLLVTEVLVAMDEGGAAGGDAGGIGIEYRMMYNKAVEEFICSSEMAFRTLLKE